MHKNMSHFGCVALPMKVALYVLQKCKLCSFVIYIVLLSSFYTCSIASVYFLTPYLNFFAISTYCRLSTKLHSEEYKNITVHF